MYAKAAAQRYQQVGLQSEILTASPHRLIQLLLEGALARINQARGAMQAQRYQIKGERIAKTLDIIAGLRSALNFEAGGELAQRLDYLYGYSMLKLAEANRSNDERLLDEVAALLRKVKEGWDGITDQVEE